MRLSYDSHRFRVVFESDAATVLPITLTSVKAAASERRGKRKLVNRN